MRLRFTKKLFLSASLALVLSACSSSNNDDPATILKGVFLDAPVMGLNYTSTPSGRSGMTNELGQFEYIAGDTVAFTLGNGTPLDIGSAEAKPEVRVTELPEWLDVARTLQTLDTAPDEGLIDVGQITIPGAILDQLASLLEDGDGDIETILSDANIQAIEDASQPEEGSDEEAVDLVNDTVVTESDAIAHVDETIGEDFTTADFAKQVYKRPNSGPDDLDIFMYFAEDGSGNEYWEDEEDGDQTESFSWEIDENDNVVITYPESTITANLIAVEGNEYIVSTQDSEGGGSSGPIYKSLPLSIEDLDGKIIGQVTQDDECVALTIKFTGDTFTVKESCEGGFYETSGSIEDSADFDNTIVVSGTNAEGESFSVLLTLIEGEITEGSNFKFSILDINTRGTYISEDEYKLVDSELEAPEGFTSEDFSRQVYVLEEDEMILAFGSDGSGTELNDGDGDGNPYEADFNWSIDSLNRAVVDYGDELVTVTQLDMVENAVTVSAKEDGEDDADTVVLLKALPLSLEALDGKIISINMDGDSTCTALTLKFTGTSVRWAAVCSDLPGGSIATQETVSMHPDYDNVVVVTFTNGDTTLFALTSGDLDSSGTFATSDFEDDEIDGVRGKVIFTLADEEAVPAE